MPVSPRTAYKLLHAFGMLEFELKRISRFVGIRRDGSAQVSWRMVDRAVDLLAHHEFLNRVSAQTRDKLLGAPRNRPMIEVAELAGGITVVRFEERDLPVSDAEALVVATRRVRNNLFHGGKEDPLQEPYDGDDEEWAEAAHEVADVLLELVHSGQIGR